MRVNVRFKAGEYLSRSMLAMLLVKFTLGNGSSRSVVVGNSIESERVVVCEIYMVQMHRDDCLFRRLLCHTSCIRGSK